MAKTLVIRLTANTLGEDVQDMTAFLEREYPVETLKRETAQVMVGFSEEVDENALEEALKQYYADVASGLEWS